MSRGMHWLLAAQFFSGLADNALLVIAIAQLMAMGAPVWMAPMLKFCFTLAYVLLAPWVGALADRWPKALVMLAANLLKAGAACGMVLGLHPLFAFALAGLGAAIYSPAKYGLITEQVPPAMLVRANGWIEVSTVCAIVLGTGFGGLLVSARMPGVGMALAVVLATYALAGLLNLLIPRGVSHGSGVGWAPAALVGRFAVANATLWRDAQGGLSLAITTLFWGAGATLQLVVLAWAQDALDLGLDQAAYLQAVVALGIVAGAALAGRLVRLHQAPRVLPLGVLMGAGVPLMVSVDTLPVAVVLLTLIGALAGLLVVPMNALLQHRGHVLLRPGESIAVQNFNENLGVLLMLGVYAALLGLDQSIALLTGALGACVALGTLLAAGLYARRSAARPHCASAPQAPSLSATSSTRDLP
ncbi:MAG: lysophospholipid transporter LplT [Pseudacidovorax sp.]|uniref:lysophospholipid transporter LplT n=1 Tax=Pseudacidovorax sp. TaxID=1934311 RepID=UPI001B59F483|nr:lysophospholipid transporter LplT [Pseudacidovorax sp.]MBP6898111.1 lysophospholipid transporter LplT [Pseudacidovorax sp.]